MSKGARVTKGPSKRSVITALVAVIHAVQPDAAESPQTNPNALGLDRGFESKRRPWREAKAGLDPT